VRQLPLTGEETSGAEPLIPERPALKTLREAAAGCTACPLHETGTQTVFGEGLKRARLMLIGEQPGDREDIEGHPFVGPDP
jgi:uracil-DNA glycosylase